MVIPATQTFARCNVQAARELRLEYDRENQTFYKKFR